MRKLSPTVALKAARHRATRFQLDKGWFDLWHTHFDWWGYGGRSRKARRLYLGVLFTAFERALQQAGRRNLQIFLSIDRSQPDQDALYVHSPNPNGTAYPHPFARCTRMQRLPALLRDFVDKSRFEVLRTRSGDGTSYVVRPLGVAGSPH